MPLPEPIRLVLLEQLPSTTTGSKIRFLGCVHAYDGERGTLLLSKSYPAREEASAARVNVEAVLENLSHDLLQVGTWLNIVGRVRRSGRRSASRARGSESGHGETRLPRVDATMVWSAGAVMLEQYEAAVSEYQHALPAG